MPSSEFVNVNGLRLHCLDFGNREKPPLVCIHGLSDNAHNFDGLAPHLADDWHVMALDVRGRGDSQWGPSGEYNAPVYVSDLVAMLDALGISRVALIGTSMGGIIAMMFAGGYPDRVDRLALNDIGPEADPAGLGRITAYMTSSPSSFGDLEEVMAYYRENYPPLRQTPDDVLRDFVKWSVRPGPDRRFAWKLDPAVRNVPRTGSAARPMDLWLPYARITAPVLAIRGAESDILAHATTAQMRVVQRRTTVVEVPGVGHAPSLMEPAALAAIKEFFAR